MYIVFDQVILIVIRFIIVECVRKINGLNSRRIHIREFSKEPIAATVCRVWLPLKTTIFPSYEISIHVMLLKLCVDADMEAGRLNVVVPFRSRIGWSGISDFMWV